MQVRREDVQRAEAALAGLRTDREPDEEWPAPTAHRRMPPLARIAFIVTVIVALLAVVSMVVLAVV